MKTQPITEPAALAFQRLYASLHERLRPEDVADAILVACGDDFVSADRILLDKAAKGSLRRRSHALTSMMQDFQKPITPQRQVSKACTLFPTTPPLSPEEALDPVAVRSYVDRITAEIHKSPAGNDFRHHRLNGADRKAAGLDLSRRRYNKLFRFLARFEEKLAHWEYERRKYRAGLIAKSGLAHTIARDDFMTDPAAACFAAYYTARANRRSVFTNQSQEKAFDTIAHRLLEHFKKEPSAAGWRVVARVMPDADHVRALTDADKLVLFGQWWQVLEDIADLLQKTWQRSRFDRTSMIVRRGDDSSTWNALAGAWNHARLGWLSLVHAMGMEETLDRVCFGKVMRLMAADVAAWHRQSGGTVEPDTLIWADLPAPWDVFNEQAVCTRDTIIAACRRHGVDPKKKGWIMPRSTRQAVAFSPTPELVHGVVVSSPELALALRRAGWFSGKASTDPGLPLTVHRDTTGAALRVDKG